VLLFKHSRYCGVSCEALDELQSHIDGSDKTDVSYRMITVQTHRPVSDAAAQRLGLRHETPQAILLRDGKVIWNASHFRITATQLDQALPKA
jgi:bacillithiol system protein YtxJ